MPKIGLGTWQLTGNQGYTSVRDALDIGYRHIDTAYYYDNHKVVGRAISDSEVDRDDIFLTTKIWRDHLTQDDLREKLQESLQQLKTDYVDLLLVHWPNQSVPISETLSAMENLQQEEKVRSFGVSNFTKGLLQDAVKASNSTAVNQVEYHPSLNQAGLLDFCRNNDITVTAYSPLGRGQDLKLQSVKEVANTVNAAPSQIIISWLNQKGVVAIPKASSRKHLKQNLQASAITLSQKQMQKIDQCDAGNRLIAPSFGPFS